MKIYTYAVDAAYTADDSRQAYGVGFQAEGPAQIALLEQIATQLGEAVKHTSATTAILHIASEELLTAHLTKIQGSPSKDNVANRLINQAYIALHTRQPGATDLEEFDLPAPAEFIQPAPSEPRRAESLPLPRIPRHRRSPIHRPSPIRRDEGQHADPAGRSTPSPSAPSTPSPSVSSTTSASIFSSPTQTETGKLALAQTTAARACLYWPSEVLTHELQTAANTLSAFVKDLPPPLVIGLCARLFGPEGLRPDPSYIELTTNQSALYGDGTSVSVEQAELAEHCRKILLFKVLAPVALADDRRLLGHQRAITIALMGDIGAFMAATGATTGTERPAWVSKGLQKAFSDFALKLEGKELSATEASTLVHTSVERCKALGGGEVVGPTKKLERTRIEREHHLPRTGIHDTGLQADAALGLLGQAGTLPKSTWATARVHEERMRDITEPFAGHMSASPSEILWTWDVLAGRGLDHAYSGTVPEAVVTVAIAEKNLSEKEVELKKATEALDKVLKKGWGPTDDPAALRARQEEAPRSEEARVKAFREVEKAKRELADAKAAWKAAPPTLAALTYAASQNTVARSAGACALLVGCGYHSALEVTHGTMVYQGQVPDKTTLKDAGASRRGEQDIGSVLYAGSATGLVDDLLEHATSADGLEALEKQLSGGAAIKM